MFVFIDNSSELCRSVGQQARLGRRCVTADNGNDDDDQVNSHTDRRLLTVRRLVL